MKKKSPVSVGRIQFYTYERHEDENIISFIDQFPYDDRRDFAVDKHLAAIAAKIEIYNDSIEKGVRRNIALTLADMTTRCEAASRHVKVNIRKNIYMKEIYVNFPIETTALSSGHTYRLTVCDATSAEKLTETVFHLFDRDTLGHPAKWYEIIDCGIKPAWESRTYKVLKTADSHDYYVRFRLTPMHGHVMPATLPELEMRLYYPDGQNVAVHFKEPVPSGLEDYENNILTVDYPFETSNDDNGVFYAELLCMEYPIGGFVFDTEREDVSGSWFGREAEPLDEYTPAAAAERLNNLLPVMTETSSGLTDKDFDDMLQEYIDSQQSEAGTETGSETAPDENEDNATDEYNKPDGCRETSLLSSLDHLVGLRNVKEKLTIYENVVRFNNKRAGIGLPITSTPLHAMFLGSPGTGKTTVAKLMGKMLHQAGVLSKGHVVVRERATLLGQFYHSEAEKTLAAIEEAKGGILFIDEAYQLYQPNDSKDPGKFVIETLLTALADENNRDWMLVLAGYPDRMKQLFDLNPGFRSRIPDSNIYIFEDFTESELMAIAENYFTHNNYTLTPDARNALTKRLKTDYERRERNFGNARHIINLIQTEILPAMAVRVINEGLNDNASLTEIQMSDIPMPVSKPIPSRQRIGFIL